jgi:predicted amidohydrolase YtcJ
MKAGQLVREVQMLVVILGLVSCLWVANAWAGEGGKADVVLQNGKIYTADPDRSIKQSVAFSGNTIMAVGSDGDMEALIDPETKVIDLRGKLVLPGLIDTHIHPIVGAVDNAKCSLAGVKHHRGAQAGDPCMPCQ